MGELLQQTTNAGPSSRIKQQPVPCLCNLILIFVSGYHFAKGDVIPKHPAHTWAGSV